MSMKLWEDWDELHEERKVKRLNSDPQQFVLEFRRRFMGVEERYRIQMQGGDCPGFQRGADPAEAVSGGGGARLENERRATDDRGSAGLVAREPDRFQRAINDYVDEIRDALALVGRRLGG